MKAELVWDLKATLGEGPVWDGSSLWLTDIKGRKIHNFRLDGGRDSFAVAGEVGFLLPALEGGLLLGMDQALYHAAVPGEAPRLLTKLKTAAGNRINDGTADRSGRVWLCTMDNAEKDATGEVMRWDGGEAVVVSGRMIVANGPAVSDDGVIYYADSPNRIVWRARIADDGSLIETAKFVELTDADGHPDGVTLDAEGGLWMGTWAGHQLRRYDARGVLSHTVKLPCTNVTKVAFGGDRLRTGYVTTARAGLEPDVLAKEPLAGGLFAFESPVAGVPGPKARVA